MAVDGAQDSYITMRPGVEATGEFIDRKSRFIAQLVHVASEEDAAQHIATVRARHYDARHNVPAWILLDGRERQSDDGEPSRTSGMPTLEVLRGAGLKDVCCVVTRYFGGTLLGPGGLVRAYSAATRAAIDDARARGLLVEMTSVTPVHVAVPYARYETALRMARDAGAHDLPADFAADVTLNLVFRSGEERAFIAALTEAFGGEPDELVEEARFAEF